MKNILLILAVALVLANSAYADRGQVILHHGVDLTQESQKAIILHNRVEEVLILGTELKANKETDILEFIPFPSEPKVNLAEGNPFEEVSKLIKKKELVFQFYSITKGGRGSATAPVEIRLSEKIGLHDVTAIKINDIGQFSKWLEDFFKSKGIEADKEKLSNVYGNARDYINRGYNYFVFDLVKVSGKTKFLEPLVYRFKTDKIYYPLKTSNLVGGSGAVEMIMILPGSISDDIWQNIRQVFPAGEGVVINLSSSSKVYSKELEAIYPAGPFFGKTGKIYMQVFKYGGPYNFKDDLTYDISKLVPYAYKYRIDDPIMGGVKEFVPPFTKDEKRDLREAFCPLSDLKSSLLAIEYRLDCWDYIPNDEYEVYAALFKKGELSGIPSGYVVLENSTVRKKLKDIKIDKAMLNDFNKKNKVSYPLEKVFPENGDLTIKIRGDEDKLPFFAKGNTYISRAGFNKDRAKALVYVEYIAGPRSGVGYFVITEKKGGEWKIADAIMGIMY